MKPLPIISFLIGVAFVLPGCLPGGDGGGGGSGVIPDPNGSTAGPTTVDITPPADLILDNQPVSSGEFVVTEAVALAFEGGQTQTQVVTADMPVVINALIGQGLHELFEVPPDTRAIMMKGRFDATEPDLPPANFDITVFGDFSEPIEFTVFLPASTSDSANQITGSNRDGTETNVFKSEGLSVDSFGLVVENAGDDPGNIDVGSEPIVLLADAQIQMTEHGTAGSNPSVQDSNFDPGNNTAVNSTTARDCGSTCNAEVCQVIGRLCDVYRDQPCFDAASTPTCESDLGSEFCTDPGFLDFATHPNINQCLNFLESYQFEPNEAECDIRAGDGAVCDI